MIRRFRPQLCWVGSLVLCGVALAQTAQGDAAQRDKLALQFKAAVDEYQAGKLSLAATHLEVLIPQTPKSFNAHELLGLIYAAEALYARSEVELTIAVQLNPNSAAARTNLATSLVHLGRSDAAGEQYRKALELEPESYSANHNLGEFYIQAGRIADALPMLKTAQRINASAYDNGYDLVLAELMSGEYSHARELGHTLTRQKDTGEMHNLLGQIEEKDGKFVEAANEFEVAAHMDPSEENLFAWGSELLLHRTYEPAIEVFQQGTQRYPASPRLMMGLGMALYSRGKYDDAIKKLLAASDLNPTDARCYLFLSKAYESSPTQADDVIQRFRRYAELQPANAMAQYYYAVSLWKGKRAEGSTVELQAVETLLQKSIALDGTIADAHLQLGILYANEHEYAKALPEYQRALQLNSNLPDAHYRLGQYYVRVGQKEQAQQEFEVYQKQRAQHQAEIDKERAEVEQFVYAATNGPAVGSSARP